MQHALQRLAERGIVRIVAPVAHGRAYRGNQLLGFVDEDLQELGIDVVVEPPLAALERNIQIEFIQRTVAFLGFGELLGHTALRFAGRRGLRRRFPFLGRRRFLRDARLLPDALQPRDQLRDGSRHTQFDYARNHCLDRVDRLSDQRLFVLGKLAGREFLQRLLQRIAKIREGRDLYRPRSARERVHRT